MDRKDILKENINEYFSSAEDSYEKGRWNSALVLYFKAMTSAVDLYIYKKMKLVPKDHEERFKILKDKFPFIYEIVDRDFPLYRDTYTLTVHKEAVELVRNDFNEIIKEFD